MNRPPPIRRAGDRQEKRLWTRRPGVARRWPSTTKWLLLAAAACLSVLAFLGAYSLDAFDRWKQPETAIHGRSTALSPRSDADLSEHDPPVATLPPVPVTDPETAEAIVDEGRRVLEHLVRRFPDQPDAHEVRARLHAWMDETVEAIECWEKCLELDPAYAYAYSGLASVATDRGEHAKAAALHRRAAELMPQSPQPRTDLAAALLAEGRPDEAVELLQETVASFPQATDAHYQLGVAHQHREDFAEAKRSFERALELEPRYSAAQIGLARACMRLGLDEEAQKYQEMYQQLSARERAGSRRNRLQFNDLRATSQDVAELYVDAGRIYLAQGDPAAAQLVWRRAAVLDPQDFECRQALVWLHLQRGDRLKAVQRLQEMADLAPNNHMFPLQMAQLYAQTGATEKTEELLRSVCEMAPDDPVGHTELAKLYLQLDRNFPEALKLARRAVECAPTAENYVLLSGCYERNRNWPKAAEAMAEACLKAPQNVRYRQMHEALRLRTESEQNR